MAEQQKACFRTSIGGQALIEGIMMRGPEKQSVVVRDQNGQLVEKVEDLKFIKDRYPVLGWPLIRGVVNFLGAMVNGVRALMYSADFYPEEDEGEPSKLEQWLEAHLSSKKLESLVLGLAVCDEIVHLHNGTFDIGNAEGGGCIVTIRLPMGNE